VFGAQSGPPPCCCLKCPLARCCAQREQRTKFISAFSRSAPPEAIEASSSPLRSLIALLLLFLLLLSTSFDSCLCSSSFFPLLFPQASLSILHSLSLSNHLSLTYLPPCSTNTLSHFPTVPGVTSLLLALLHHTPLVDRLQHLPVPAPRTCLIARPRGSPSLRSISPWQPSIDWSIITSFSWNKRFRETRGKCVFASISRWRALAARGLATSQYPRLDRGPKLA